MSEPWDQDVDLDNDPPPEDPQLVEYRAAGWEDFDPGLSYGAVTCHRCGNAAGLMVRRNGHEEEIVCKGCLVFGHPSFAELDVDELPYDPEATAQVRLESQYAIWWLSQAELEHVLLFRVSFKDAAFESYKALWGELCSMEGRTLRGRLWNPHEVELEVPAWCFESIRGSFLGRRCGGIVIERSDLEVLQDLFPGTMTDFQLKRIP